MKQLFKLIITFCILANSQWQMANCQNIGTNQAMNILQHLSKNFNCKAGITMDIEMNGKDHGTTKLKLMKNNDKSKMIENNEETYFFNQLMWTCNGNNHNVVMSNKNQDETKLMTQMALLPSTLKGGYSSIGNNAFSIGNNKFTFTTNQNKITYHLNQGKYDVSFTVDALTKDIEKMNISHGGKQVDLTYKNITEGCGYNDVSFNTSDYSDYKYIDKR